MDEQIFGVAVLRGSEAANARGFRLAKCRAISGRDSESACGTPVSKAARAAIISMSGSAHLGSVRLAARASSRAGKAMGWWPFEDVGEDGVTLGGLVDGLDLGRVPGIEENLDGGAAVAAGYERAVSAGFEAGVAL